MCVLLYEYMGRDSSVGIATRYGLDSPGIEFRWGRDFPHQSRPALGPTHLLYNGYRVSSRRQSGREVALTTHLHLEPRLKKE